MGSAQRQPRHEAIIRNVWEPENRKVRDEEGTLKVPLAEMLAERKKRQAAEQRVHELEAADPQKMIRAFRIALVALGADPEEIIAELNR
jgi:hypothetical protein